MIPTQWMLRRQALMRAFCVPKCANLTNRAPPPADRAGSGILLASSGRLLARARLNGTILPPCHSCAPADTLRASACRHFQGLLDNTHAVLSRERNFSSSCSACTRAARRSAVRDDAAMSRVSLSRVSSSSVTDAPACAALTTRFPCSSVAVCLAIALRISAIRGAMSGTCDLEHSSLSTAAIRCCIRWMLSIYCARLAVLSRRLSLQFCASWESFVSCSSLAVCKHQRTLFSSASA